jgi:hypothetical protein
MRPSATSVCSPKVPVYEALSYLVAQEVLEVEVVPLAEVGALSYCMRP